MFVDSQAADPAIHRIAITIALQCRHIIQGCLREEEWHDADLAFYRIVREALEKPKRQEEV